MNSLLQKILDSTKRCGSSVSCQGMGTTEAQLDHLVSDGYLEKHVVWYDYEDDPRPVVILDPQEAEDTPGVYAIDEETGEPVSPEEITSVYLTTAKLDALRPRAEGILLRFELPKDAPPGSEKWTKIVYETARLVEALDVLHKWYGGSGLEVNPTTAPANHEFMEAVDQALEKHREKRKKALLVATCPVCGEVAIQTGSTQEHWASQCDQGHSSGSAPGVDVREERP